MSIFADLALRQTHPENAATAALGYILRSSAAARTGLSNVLSAAGVVDLAADLRFENQASDGKGSIPDLIGRDNEAQEVLIVEAKFWASFTDRQPSRYLARLPRDRFGALVVLSPAARFPTLWPMILQDCCGGDAAFGDESVAGETMIARLDERRAIVLVSWRALLASMHATSVAADDHDTARDVGQLQVLCARMDGTAFIPLAIPDLSDAIGRRIWELSGLIGDLITMGKNEGLWSLKGSKYSGGQGYCGQLVEVGGRWYGLYFAAWFWMTFGQTPLWFTACDYYPANFRPMRDALREFESATPKRLFLAAGKPVVALIPRTGVERNEVLYNLLGQARSIITALNVGIPPLGAPPPPPAED